MSKEVEAGFIPANEISREVFVSPKITRDVRGRVLWKLPGNTPEENEQLGIRNVQGLFLENNHDFIENFPLGEDGKIIEDKREGGREFILEHLGSVKKLSSITGAALNKKNVPYFHGDYRIVLAKSFSTWGIIFEWEKHPPEGWVTNTGLARQISRGNNTVKNIANKYRETNPEWFGQYLDVSNRPTEHYSSELMQQIINDISKKSTAPEGWKTNEGLSKQVKRGYNFVKKLSDQYRESHPEWFGQYINSKSKNLEHYSPELIEQIERDVSNIQSAPEGWMTIGSLSKQIKRDPSTVKKLSDQYRESHPEWFGQYLDSQAKPNEHYSPELTAQIINLNLGVQSAPVGWMTVNAAATQLGINFYTVKKIVNQYSSDHPEWFKMYLDSTGKRAEHFSPELVEVMLKVLNEKRQKEERISPEQANEELMRFLEVRDE